MLIALLKRLCRWLAGKSYSDVQALGCRLGALFRILVRRQARRADLHLRQCFPDLPGAERREIVRQVFANMGMSTLEMLRWMGGAEQDLMRHIHVTGADHAEAARARGKGVAVLTAHLGNWDLMGLWAASRYPLTIISKEIKSKAANQFWMEMREKAGLKIVPAHHSYRACLSVLKKGGFLGFILDQNMTRMEGIFVDFFNRPACTTPGLAMLAAHAGSPVLPVFMIRRPDGDHEVRIMPPLDPPVDRKPETLQAATQQYTRIIEDMVREHKDQWIWMHRRWRTQPLP